MKYYFKGGKSKFIRYVQNVVQDFEIMYVKGSFLV